MDSLVIANAVGTLDKMLSQTKTALWEIGNDIFGYGNPNGGYDIPSGALSFQLQELYDVLLIVLEAGQLPEAKVSLIQAWKGFTAAKDGLFHTTNDPGYENVESPALTFFERLIGALRITVNHEVTSEQAWTLTSLEAMLEDTAGLIHRRGNPPANEADLQRIMHDYLSACFHDFRLNPPIGGTIKNFKPDCGIASVGAAIEFKIAHTKQKTVTAFSGVVEDTSGYKGSKDWTRFYAVIYQAKPFILKSHLQSDLRRIGAATWKAILVNGGTKRQAAKTTRSAKA